MDEFVAALPRRRFSFALFVRLGADDPDHVDARLREHLPRQFVRIPGTVVDLGDPGIDDHFGTDGTGLVGAKEVGTFHRHPVQGRLDDGVLFRVNAAAELVAHSGLDVEPFPQAADLGTVPDPGRGAVVAGGKDALVLDDHGPHRTPQAGGAFGHQGRDVHEIGFPGGAATAFHMLNETGLSGAFQILGEGGFQ